ncbi:hypothetical protein F3Q02_21750 [Salmonella enterica subsp. enterica]|nr:hypothetical protein [Salmonella enterica subsp. enterica]
MFGRFSFKAIIISPCTVCINSKYHTVFTLSLHCLYIVNIIIDCIDIAIKFQFPAPLIQSVLSLLKGLMPG